VRTLITEEEVRLTVGRMASEINACYGRRPLTIVGVLTGSIVLLADLIRLLEMPLRVGVVQASSYQGVERGPISLNAEFMPEITGHDVLLIDDIFDTGRTLAEVIACVRELAPAGLRSAVLLRKTGRQEVGMQPDFVGFQIPDEFVVGYGLDYHDEFRNLPYIAALEPADLANQNP